MAAGQLSCRFATLDDVAPIAAQLRENDAREVERLGWKAETVLRDGINRSECCIVYEEDGEPLGILGLFRSADLPCGDAVTWMLGTHALSRHRKLVLREARAWIGIFEETCSALHAWTDADYPGAVRWLEWLGFETVTREPGPGGGTMVKMIRRVGVVGRA